jgi:hypothetical protein
MKRLAPPLAPAVAVVVGLVLYVVRSRNDPEVSTLTPGTYALIADKGGTPLLAGAADTSTLEDRIRIYYAMLEGWVDTLPPGTRVRILYDRALGPGTSFRPPHPEAKFRQVRIEVMDGRHGGTMGKAFRCDLRPEPE